MSSASTSSRTPLERQEPPDEQHERPVRRDAELSPRLVLRELEAGQPGVVGAGRERHGRRVRQGLDLHAPADLGPAGLPGDREVARADDLDRLVGLPLRRGFGPGKRHVPGGCRERAWVIDGSRTWSP